MCSQCDSSDREDGRTWDIEDDVAEVELTYRAGSIGLLTLIGITVLGLAGVGWAVWAIGEAVRP